MQMVYIFLINSLVVAITVMVHYEFLYRVTLYIPKMNIRHRYRIVYGVFSALIAHSIEIWIFGLVYYFMNMVQVWGSLTGNIDGSLMDCAYFSFTVFTTLGFGDIEPIGHIRYLTGIESLTGLVLITWTASFLFVEMQKHWNSRE
ncbi:potassium channel family protein [Neptuniibacter sp. CAU 1671]|uniref:potassium channel family protein n=1 Tax=Neptuniibacter sp. CAU 1671 TaxID=3032593 RepID=UPI0023DA2083|nr:potassium channel family protein [Neptuniibacter sp. CAU 1671]MDF2181877.1 potassium channel family protein [Neptuniibacter sp. CAU 1671]